MRYQDCKCSYTDLTLSNLTCVGITPEWVRQKLHESRQEKSETGRKRKLKQISKHDVELAFFDGLPVSDLKHHVYGMTPPELLHTTDEGLTAYKLSSTANRLKKTEAGCRVRSRIDRVHTTLHSALARNSERDYPRGSDRSGLLKNEGINAVENDEF